MYRSHSHPAPGKRHARRQSTILGLSGMLALALVGCLTPDGTTAGTDASSYSAHSLTIAADSDWGLSSGSDTPMSAAIADTSGHVRLTHAEGMGMLEGARPVSTAMVELSAATLELASVGIAQRPPRPPMGMGARKGEHDRGEPSPMHPDDFVALVDGPITLDLLDGASTSAINDIALTDNTNYVAFLFPITAPDTAALHAEGYFENDNTAFTFVLDVPLRHPLVVPLFAGEAAEALTAHVRLAAALSHVDLDRCATAANRNAEGAYAITDPSTCGLAGALAHLGRPPHARRSAQSIERSVPTVICEGSDAWCATLPSDGTLPPRDAVCVTAIERTQQGLTLTVQEPSDSCESLTPSERPREP